MPAYVIAETDIHDPDQYERYKDAVPAALAAHGGRFVARGGELAVLEGDWDPKRLVVLEFDDLEAAKRFYLACAEFIEYPADSRILFLPIETVVAAFG